MVKDEKKFELDLTDVKSTRSVVAKQEEPAKEPGTPLPTGYVVNVTKENGQWVPVDLVELTGEEFIIWAKSVYPGDLGASDYNTRVAKVRAIEKIISFHEASFLSAKRTTDKDNVKH